MGETMRTKYYPFGECRNSPQNVPTDKLFTGQRLDDTGLYYYGARYYDATIGRFISADTVVPYPGNPQSFNRYSYCLNNPLKYVDPSGSTVMIGGFDVMFLYEVWKEYGTLSSLDLGSAFVDLSFEDQQLFYARAGRWLPCFWFRCSAVTCPLFHLDRSLLT
jgi:RHS repeat-associated protein